MGSFRSGDTRSCVNITILGDNRVEGTESFTVTLTRSNVVEISSTAGAATVEIIDDDGEFSYNTSFHWIVETHTAIDNIYLWNMFTYQWMGYKCTQTHDGRLTIS